MSAANPEKAIRALLPQPIDCGYGVRVLPLTLAHYALLEKLGSPLLATDRDAPKPSTLDLLPSLYVVTRPVRETMDTLDDLFDRAVAWAETLPSACFEAMQAAILEQIQRMMDVIPRPEEAKKKADTTAGSPPSPTGPSDKDGAGARHSKKRRYPCFPFWSGRNSTPQTPR